MNMFKSYACLSIVFICFYSNTLLAQQPSTYVRDVHKAYVDSLKQVKYDYKFPIWGQEVYQKGIDLPYPAGIMANYVWMKQGIVIDNLHLGFENDHTNIPLTEVDFIEFKDNINTSYSVNVRPDLWVLPFLNVYGIFGYANLKTEVNLTYPIHLTSVVEQSAKTAGFGVMSAFAVGGFFLSVDANFTWNKPELLDEAIPVNVLGLRLGKNFTFNKNPASNITFWVGAMRIGTSGGSTGSLTLNDAVPNFEEKKDKMVSDYYNWYDNEATLPQKAVADKILTPIVEDIDNADGEGTVKYGLDKNLEQKWNGIFGVQYQYNKRWMLRSEGGIVGDRKSILLSLNYRFLM